MKLIEHDYPLLEHELNCRIPNGTYGGVRGWETKVGQKTSFPDLLDSFLFDHSSPSSFL